MQSILLTQPLAVLSKEHFQRSRPFNEPLMIYLLDTDICIHILRQRAGMIERLSGLSPVDCAVSAITVYELFAGVAKAKDPEVERQKVELFLSVIAEMPFDHIAAEAAAKVRANLERKGIPIGPYDLLIAGQALAENLILITNNIGEFQRVSGLKLESWL